MEHGIWKPNVEMSPNCPRCGSSNTKFCYYNNYSLTQPRYFCKGCRRYWTKGGSLRNVPVGGGCRKSRRGKSLRLSSSTTTDVVSHSKSFGYGGVTRTDPTRHFHGCKGIDSSVGSCSSSDGSHIDLALVYANFLNPQQPDSNTTTSSSGFEMQELGSDHRFDHSLDLTSISEKNLDSSNVQLHNIGDSSNNNNNYLAGYISAISEAPLNDHDHRLMYYCGVESSSIHKQQGDIDHNIQQCTSNNNNNNNNDNHETTMISYGLPPLPGEEIACGEILWHNSDMMDHNHGLQVTQQQAAVVAPETDEDPNSLLFGNWSPFDLSSDDTFSRS